MYTYQDFDMQIIADDINTICNKQDYIPNVDDNYTSVSREK